MESFFSGTTAASTFAICGVGFLLIVGQLGALPPGLPVEQERAALAALGIFARLDGLRLPGPARDAQGPDWDPDLHPLVMATFARLLLPLALLVAAFIFLRGHNQPGAG